MNRIETNTRIPKAMRAPLVIAGIAAISFSAVGMTNVPLAWFHNSVAGFDRRSTQDDLSTTSVELPLLASPGAGKVRVKMSCAECGVVDSVRPIALTGNAPAVYELTIRMRDESTRVVTLSHGNWRPRDRITLIGGANPSLR
ncbi:MAG: hypothetical protein ABI541_05320 [Betaproteobacteria bacterium]